MVYKDDVGDGRDQVDLFFVGSDALVAVGAGAGELDFAPGRRLCCASQRKVSGLASQTRRITAVSPTARLC
ncbi:MAG: hypothetical protein M5U34_05325 [Chloroflexi bacterium]|nr:hypothetical protein [Chloroflexota bacterium]